MKRRKRVTGSAFNDQLWQDEEWVSQDGRRWPISQISEAHAKAILKLVEENADRLLSETRQEYVTTAGPSGEMARMAFEAELDELMRTSALDFIEELPMVRALRDRLERIETYRAQLQTMS